MTQINVAQLAEQIGEKLFDEKVLSELLEEEKTLFYHLLPFSNDKLQEVQQKIIYRPYQKGVTGSLTPKEREKKISKFYEEINTFLKAQLPAYAKHLEPIKGEYFPAHLANTKTILPASDGKRVLHFFFSLEEGEFIYTTNFLKIIERGIELGIALPKADTLTAKQRLKNLIKVAAGEKVFSCLDYFYQALADRIAVDQQAFAPYIKRVEFPENSAILCFSDAKIVTIATAAHWQQSYFIPRENLLNPEKSPAAILERLSQNRIIDSKTVSLN